MKHFRLFFLLSLLLTGLLLSATRLKKSTLTGVVYEAGTNAPLSGAVVRITQQQILVETTTTNTKGEYKISTAPGIYEVAFSAKGKITQRLTEVPINQEKNQVLNIFLKPASELEETVVIRYDINRNPEYDSGSALLKESEELKKVTVGYLKEVRKTDTSVPPPPKEAARPTEALKEAIVTGSSREYKTSAAKPAAPAVPAPLTSDVIMVKGARRKAATDDYRDGVRVSEAPTAEKIADDDGEVSKMEEIPAVEPSTPGQPAPRAGLLTAGEWNDLHNWNKHWLDLLADGETAEYQKMYQFFPRYRTTVLLTNEQDVPLADAPVRLVSGSGTTLWECRTDNTGKAELWAGMFEANCKDTAGLRAVVTINGREQTLKTLKPAKDGMNRLKINAPCTAPKNVDIVWAVDATGSMGDEIEYLKTELLDVMGRTRTALPDLSFRMGTVFYRDRDDDYLVKSSALSYDLSKTVDFIRKQSAGGGGDYPEAVHNALEEAIFNQRWSENAVARICFLVLDASPHESPEVNASLQRSIREAARRGIRIVPIASSGLQKDTEFLMKFFGLATNGTYVFLTDHSGIGGKHLAPTADEYKIENLNALLIRLITEYSTTENCEGKSAIRFEDQQQTGNTWQALYYPNPAVGQFTLELPVAVQTVTLYNSEGQAVKKVEKPEAGQHQIALGDLPDGFYTIRILKDGQWQSGKLIVTNSVGTK